MIPNYDFLPGVPSDYVLSRLAKARGHEISHGKLVSSNSSAALAVNTFAWFHDRSLGVFFRCSNQFSWSARTCAQRLREGITSKRRCKTCPRSQVYGLPKKRSGPTTPESLFQELSAASQKMDEIVKQIEGYTQGREQAVARLETQLGRQNN